MAFVSPNELPRVQASIYGGAGTSVSVAAPTALTSVTTVQALGLAVALTPVYSTRVLVSFSTTIVNSGSYATTANLIYGTGTAPANAATTGLGTVLGVKATMTGTTAQNLSATYILTGLTLGTAYWFDLECTSGTSATVTATNTTITVIEQ